MFAAHASAGKYCGYVVLEPDSDDVDGNIHANIQCDRAIAVAVRWSVEGSHARPYGFRCRYHVVNKGLTHADVRCTRGSRFVTFSAS